MDRSYRRLRGFTLIEIIVVLAIIAILAAIVAPSFSGYIHKVQVKEIVRQARIMDDELSALVGLQYAEFGYMPSVSHQQVSKDGNSNSSKVLGTGSEKVDEKNYVMLNRVNGGGFSYCTGFNKPSGGSAAPFEYVTLANVQTGRGANPTATEALRHSAGLTEFYKQTGIDLSGSAERVPGSGGNNSGNSEMERRWYAMQFYSRSDIASQGSTPYLTTRYLHPDQCYFAFYEVKYEGTWYMVMHNAKYSGTSSVSWVGSHVPLADPGKWNVYKNSDPNNFAYDNNGGTPFGTIID
ncbi:MAG: prepilin-type N-terminal cleavage/methylation domain-containing protein [Clostridiales Family XIII bacterium]|jgi:prepilin-type N-terminal cleavage/methylation domain-containing protein|nr:prepilin-type N-terminal cleavage/methylation domain-containing protein [Clostridiales Family XIII bacterium]